MFRVDSPLPRRGVQSRNLGSFRVGGGTILRGKTDIQGPSAGLKSAREQNIDVRSSAEAGAGMGLGLDVLIIEFRCLIGDTTMAGAASELYEPLNQYKPVDRNIGIVDGPFEYLTTAGMRLPLPFTTRMTVVRLGNGDLFIHSPIAFEAALADRLRAMGAVRHLVSPNQFHYAHIGEWSRAFPDAVTWASPRARERARSRSIDVRFDRDMGVEPPEEWRAEIDQTAVPGGFFGEFVFFHKDSKTLILADTIINLELDRIRQPWRFAAKLTGMYYPRGQIFFGMRLPLILQKRKTRAAVQKILSWQPERIILSHGRWFDSNASATLQRLFGWAL
jgi:hypothetical protein